MSSKPKTAKAVGNRGTQREKSDYEEFANDKSRWQHFVVLGSGAQGDKGEVFKSAKALQKFLKQDFEDGMFLRLPGGSSAGFVSSNVKQLSGGRYVCKYCWGKGVSMKKLNSNSIFKESNPNSIL